VSDGRSANSRSQKSAPGNRKAFFTLLDAIRGHVGAEEREKFSRRGFREGRPGPY